MLGVSIAAVGAGLLDDRDTPDVSRIDKATNSLIQARNNVITGSDKKNTALNAHVDAMVDGDLTDVA